MKLRTVILLFLLISILSAKKYKRVRKPVSSAKPTIAKVQTKFTCSLNASYCIFGKIQETGWLSHELLQLPFICNRRGGPVLQKVAPFVKNYVFKKKEYQIKLEYYHNCSTDNMVRKIEKSLTYIPIKKTKGASLFKIQLKDNGYIFDQTFGPFVAKLVFPDNILDWGLGRIVHKDDMGKRTKFADKHGNLYWESSRNR